MQGITGSADVEAVRDSLREVASSPLTDASEERSPPRFIVLLVDDNDDLRYVMGLILSTMGFEVISCSDADSASAAFLARKQIDLLITDVEMPGRSGLELARELCGRSSSLPVLVVSGAYLSTDSHREMRERDWRFLAKPYALRTFSTTVHTLLSTGIGQQQAV